MGLEKGHCFIQVSREEYMRIGIDVSYLNFTM